MIDVDKYKLLSKIDSPEDLRELDITDLPNVCDELRNFIIESNSQNPAHFGASLGVVELTVAMHYAYNTPRDLIVWDVGHQAYGHKVLTGRKKQFHTNRKYKGISGFPNPKESIYDSFGAGHASISISAALGMATASKFQNIDRKTIAVIGDGALSGGEAFEGLNNVAATNSDVLIILNDNKIAIDKNTGALTDYLTDIATSKTYNRIKDDVWKFLGKVSKIGVNVQNFTQKIDHAVKSIVMKNGNLFESLDIRYFGPVDGHDVESLTKLLSDIKNIGGPKLLHVITKKGKGFEVAEKYQTKWHAAPGKFDISTGEIFRETKTCEIQAFQDVFGDAIVELAAKNDKIVAITPAMVSGSSLVKMSQQFPNRCFDVGIAEQHAVTFAAGLAKEGMTPFCCIYSSFLQRAYDQLIHDVALQNIPVIFCIDRAGIVGHDGATHHGVFDISFLRCVPNLIIAAPRDEFQLRNLMYTAQLQKHENPIVIRYPRGKSSSPKSEIVFNEIEFGKGKCEVQGSDLAIVSVGPSTLNAINLANELKQTGVNISVYDMIFVKPLDYELMDQVCEKHKYIVTIEDNVVAGGFGSAVLEYVSEKNYDVKLTRLGIPDRFIEHGTQSELIEECGFDLDGLRKTVLSILDC